MENERAREAREGKFEPEPRFGVVDRGFWTSGVDRGSGDAGSSADGEVCSAELRGGGWPSDRDQASRAACSSACSSGSKSCNTSSMVCF